MFAPPEPSITDHIKGVPTTLNGSGERVATYLRDYTSNFSHRIANILYPENMDHINLPSAQFAAQFPGSAEHPRQILAGTSNTPVQFFCQSFNPMQTGRESQPYVTLSIGELYSYKDKCDTGNIIPLIKELYEHIQDLRVSEGGDRFVYAQVEEHINTLFHEFRKINETLHIETPYPGKITHIVENLYKDLSKTQGSDEQNKQIIGHLAPCIEEIKKYQKYISQYHHAKFARIQHQSKLGKEANAIISLDDTSTYIQKLMFAAIHENRYKEGEHALTPLLSHLRENVSIRPLYITQIEVAPSSKGKGYSKALLDGIAWVSEHGMITGDLTYAIVEQSNQDKEKMISSFQKAGYQIYAFNKGSLHTEAYGGAYLAIRINPQSSLAKIHKEERGSNI